MASFKVKLQEVTTVILHTDNENGKLASWGSNNNFPQQLLKKIKGAGSLRSGLRTNRKAHYGSGFILTKETHEDGKRKIEQVCLHEYKEIHDFFKRNQMKRFFREKIADLEYWALACTEYVLSNDFKKINRVKRQQTANCRFELMDEKTLSIKNVHVSSKWDEGEDVGSKYVTSIAYTDSYWTPCKCRGDYGKQ